MQERDQRLIGHLCVFNWQIAVFCCAFASVFVLVEFNNILPYSIYKPLYLAYCPYKSQSGEIWQYTIDLILWARDEIDTIWVSSLPSSTFAAFQTSSGLHNLEHLYSEFCFWEGIQPGPLLHGKSISWAFDFWKLGHLLLWIPKQEIWHTPWKQPDFVSWWLELIELWVFIFMCCPSKLMHACHTSKHELAFHSAINTFEIEYILTWMFCASSKYFAARHNSLHQFILYGQLQPKSLCDWMPLIEWNLLSVKSSGKLFQCMTTVFLSQDWLVELAVMMPFFCADRRMCECNSAPCQPERSSANRSHTAARPGPPIHSAISASWPASAINGKTLYLNII